MKPTLLLLIKSLSILLISGAIGLELWHLYAEVTQHSFPAIPSAVFWVGRFALVVHAIEGAIAAGCALRQQQAPIPYAIYTFFVGTIGLVELFKPDTAR